MKGNCTRAEMENPCKLSMFFLEFFFLLFLLFFFISALKLLEESNWALRWQKKKRKKAPRTRSNTLSASLFLLNGWHVFFRNFLHIYLLMPQWDWLFSLATAEKAYFRSCLPKNLSLWDLGEELFLLWALAFGIFSCWKSLKTWLCQLAWNLIMALHVGDGWRGREKIPTSHHTSSCF